MASDATGSEASAVGDISAARASATAKNALGNKHAWKNDYTTALALYTAAIKEWPESPVLYSNRSLCFLKTGDNLKALQDAEQSVRLDKRSVIGWLSVAHCKLWIGDTQGVVHALQQARDVEPSNFAVCEALKAAVALQNNVKAITDSPDQNSEVASILKSLVKV